MIRLIKNFKYNNNYDYVKLFTNKNEQYAYFDNLNSIDIEEHEYIKDNNSFRVKYSYEELLLEGINYLTFNNGDKDIYAFIVRKEYVNSKVTSLVYEIDVFQTFMFDIKLEKSFVERKVCNINEITDFDEGLYLGEHSIVERNDVLMKTSKYFAMFNGFKEQELIFNDNGKLLSSVDIPYSTSKPLTNIDNIQYPLYFMPLLEQNSYRLAELSEIGISTGGEIVNGDAISKRLFRFIKGYEAFSSESYLDSGGVPTIGYGITESNPYWNTLFPLCTEEVASNVLAEAIYNNYAVPLYEDMQSNGIDMAFVKQRHFDAFLDLAFNGGLGAVTSSPMYIKWLVDNDDSTVTNDWISYYIKDNNGVVQEGLVDRRMKEVEIFSSGNYVYKPIAIVGGGTVTDNNGNGFIPNGLGGEL